MCRWIHRSGAVVALAAGLTIASCSGTPSVGSLRCVAGEIQPCFCGAKTPGEQVCGESGSYLACICAEPKDSGTGQSKKEPDGGSEKDGRAADGASKDGETKDAAVKDGAEKDGAPKDGDAEVDDAETTDAPADESGAKDGEANDAAETKDAPVKDAQASDAQVADAQARDAKIVSDSGDDSGDGGGTCPLPGKAVTMIDDGSEGDTMGEILQQCGRQGYWYTFHDGGTQTPAQGAPVPIVTTNPPNGVTGYVETTGTLGSDAALGFSFLYLGGTQNYDATQQHYTGLSFWMLSAYAPANQPEILLQVPDAETAPTPSYTTFFGVQIPAPPQGVWTKYSYAWTDLHQIDSTETGLDLQKLQDVQWEFKATSPSTMPFDIAIGDVEFTQ